MVWSARLHMDNHHGMNEKEVQVLVFGNNVWWFWPALTFGMGGNLRLSLCTVSRISICIATRPVG